MKMHLLKCAQAQKRIDSQIRLATDLREAQWYCKWGSCNSSDVDSYETAAAHMSQHLNASYFECRWQSCGYIAHDRDDMHAHLAVEHGTHTQETIPTQSASASNAQSGC